MAFNFGLCERGFLVGYWQHRITKTTTIKHPKGLNPPAPEPIPNDVEYYEVEAVVGKRTVKGKVQYMVKWLGYPDSDNEWKWETELQCPELVEQFEEQCL